MNQMDVICRLFYHRIIKGFSDFVLRPDSKELVDKNMTFQKLDLFPSSGEGRHLLCWVPRDYHQLDSLKTRSHFRLCVQDNAAKEPDHFQKYIKQ
jgi:hypothetical protein